MLVESNEYFVFLIFVAHTIINFKFTYLPYITRFGLYAISTALGLQLLVCKPQRDLYTS